jgi:tetratricopeptide (TPR) repeat protein
MIKRIGLFVCLVLLFNPFSSLSQENADQSSNLSEEKEMKFQEYFFKSLSNKSIRNYQKAIQNLEVCDKLSPRNKTIYFEFSKNYLFLNQTLQARQFIEKALEQDSSNIWMLLHFVSILKKDRNYEEAIKVQLKIIELDPYYRESLIYLYHLNSQSDKALSLIYLLEQEKGLHQKLERFKEKLELSKKPVKLKKDNKDLDKLISDFNENKPSFSMLKQILEIAEFNNSEILDNYSKLAVTLFPAQPFSYLSRAKLLHKQQQFDEAIAILEIGLDFVIENPTLEAQFYSTLAKVYSSLGNNGKAFEFENKIKKLKM